MRRACVLLVLALIACEGPAGPAGPQGEPGANGLSANRWVSLTMAPVGNPLIVQLPAEIPPELNSPPGLTCYLAMSSEANVWNVIGSTPSPPNPSCQLWLRQGRWEARAFYVNGLPTLFVVTW
jgi:hypothetical protein